MRLLKSLYFQVIIAIILAILFGNFYPQQAVEMKPLGDGFIKLIKMVVGPIIFCTIVSGMVGSEEPKSIGRIGLKMFVYFEILTTLAIIIGFAVAHITNIGSGMNVDLTKVDTSSIQNYSTTKHNNISDFFLNIIPNTIIDAFAKGDILSILLVALLFGFVLSVHRKQVPLIISLIEQLSLILFKIVNIIVRLAPIGAFGAMSFTIGKYGIGSLVELGLFVLIFYLSCLAFVLLILGAIARFCGFNILNFLRYIKEELFITFGTSSSESALPNLMKKLENLGCKRSIVGLVVPSGYSFNLDGSSMYFSFAIIFIAKAANIDLTISQQISIILILLVTSKGAAGVVGSAFITMAATLSVIHTIPLAGLVLILGVDRFMSEARALTNIIGNGVATIAIAKWENALDQNKLKEELTKTNQM